MNSNKLTVQLRLLLVVLLIAVAFSAEAAPLVVLDSGHTPSAPGAVGSCGKREVDYNDVTVKAVQAQLEAGKYSVELTRQFQKEVAPEFLAPISYVAGRESRPSLLRRADIANNGGAQFFVSIHHDSTDDAYLVHDPSICNGRGGLRLSEDFKKNHKIGYNIFVAHGDASHAQLFQDSVFLASLVGKRLQAAGMIASDYHIKPVEDCTSCRPLDQPDGVWDQELAVLKATKMPSILIETENIADPDYEKIANSPGFDNEIARAVKGGLDEFCALKPAACASSTH